MARLRTPRFQVRSVSGYTCGKLVSAYWVADTWYCWREVELWAKKSERDAPCGKRITDRCSQAERTCARLNAANDEWLAAG